MIPNLQLNNNGIITSDQHYKEFTPNHFSEVNGNLTMIAPFWADIDTFEFGVVYYRTTAISTLLARADEYVHQMSKSFKNFSTKELVITTWDGVGYYSHTPINKVS